MKKEDLLKEIKDAIEKGKPLGDLIRISAIEHPHISAVLADESISIPEKRCFFNALLLAVRNGMEDIEKKLMSGAKVIESWETYNHIAKLLLSSVERRDIDSVGAICYLLTKSDNIHLKYHSPDKSQESTAPGEALLNAVALGYKDIVEILLDANIEFGYRLRAMDRYTDDALHIAAMLGKEDIVKVLLDKYEYDTVTRMGNRVLDLAHRDVCVLDSADKSKSSSIQDMLRKRIEKLSAMKCVGGDIDALLRDYLRPLVRQETLAQTRQHQMPQSAHDPQAAPSASSPRAVEGPGRENLS